MGTQTKSTAVGPADSAVERKIQLTPDAPERSIVSIEYGTTEQLFDEIRKFLAQHPGLTTDAVLKLTYFLLAILFPEYAAIWPFVSIVSADSVGSSLLLRMIKSVCLAPLHLGEVTLSALLTLPASPRPTLLLIDQPAPNKELERVLRIVSRPGGRVLRNGKFHDVCLPTLLCTSEPLHDRWILEQAIHVALTPSCGRLPKCDPESLSESARILRGKSFRYRELNLSKVRDSRFDAPDFSSPMREIACMLGNCVVGETSLQRCLLMLLEPQEQDVRIRRTDSIEAVVAEAVLFLSHEGRRSEARVGEITTIANGILAGRGENIAPDPRAVGHLLRSLGLFSQRLGRAGRGIRFTREIRRQIHQLANAYDVRTVLDKSSCEFCAEVGPRTVAPRQKR